MSNKSLFEKLFEEVMQDDAEALGLPGGDEGGDDMGGMGEEGGMGDEGGDMVTLRLPRDVAQQLHDALAAELGGEEEGEDFGSEEGPEGEEEFGGGASEGDEAAEDEDEEGESEDAEDEDEDGDEASEELTEAPQSQYKPFETKGKADQFQKKTNARVSGALADKTSAHGKAQKTAQTQGTAHYMPASTKYTDGKGSGMKVNNPHYSKTQGEGESIFS